MSGQLDESVERVLTAGDMEVHGRIAGSSNATLLVTCRLGGEELLAVYKPARGERPLWDFPGGLFRREVAAFLLSEALGWGLVPETFERSEGPYGEGSVQRFVHEDGTSHYFTLRDDPRWHAQLIRMCAFDVVANNADRKSGHVLLAEDRLWAIDNGLCFNEHDKLRTVIWDFGGCPLTAEDRAALVRLTRDGPPPGLRELLSPVEVAAVIARADWLVHLGALPELVDDGDWPPYPWPLV
ncbi:MAG TPA: SCO1664 family protein [Acidimicrobiales bacterium]|nr:SCO1664 family protein [Acidimicrobiales bacterium]